MAERIEVKYRLNLKTAQSLKEKIHSYAAKLENVKIMNFCGTHEWTTVHYGLRSLMPENVELIAGPGCPVCITPSYAVESAIALSLEGYKVYTYGDAYKLPALNPVKGVRSLEEAKAKGGNVSLVYSFLDAIEDAKKEKGEKVFFGIGFETTAPSYAVSIFHGLVPKGLYFLSVLRLTPPAADFALNKVGLVSGIIAPGHVSTITGARPWKKIAERYSLPVVISGFEPLDVLLSVAFILKMLVDGERGLKIEYRRAVNYEGNPMALRHIRKVFEEEDAGWRGIGVIPKSGLELRKKFRELSAYDRFSIEKSWSYDLPKGCRCAEITLGMVKPTDCKYYMKACTPERPIGPCMVSSEGTCAIWARFGGGGLAEELARELGMI